MRISKILLRILAFILAFVLVDFLFVFMLEPVTFEHFLKIDKKKMKAEGKTIEMAFFGDSRAMRTFDPDTFDKILGNEVDGVVNEAVNQQHIKSTYYFMKDYLKHHTLKYAVVNLNYDYFLTTTEEPIEAKGLTFDRIKSLSGMADFAINRFSLKEYPSILKSYRYRWQVKAIEENLKAKLSSAYKEGVDTRSDIHYVSKGYATWDLAYEQGDTGAPAGVQSWSADVVDKEALECLSKISTLCQEYGVKLYFVESPITIGRMYAIDGYRDFTQTISHECDLLSVPFYNMNLMMQDSLSLDDTNFSDTEHLNDIGSLKCSKQLAKLMKLDIDGNENVKNMFYDSFDAFDMQNACIGAVSLHVWDTDTEREQIKWEELSDVKDEAGKLILNAFSFKSNLVNPLYQFAFSYDDGKTYEVMQDYSIDHTYVLDKADIVEGMLIRVDTKPELLEDRHHSYVIRTCED